MRHSWEASRLGPSGSLDRILALEVIGIAEVLGEDCVVTGWEHDQIAVRIGLAERPQGHGADIPRITVKIKERVRPMRMLSNVTYGTTGNVAIPSSRFSPVSFCGSAIVVEEKTRQAFA